MFSAPLDVYLDDVKNAVQPDLLFISKTNSVQPQDSVPYRGVPDLLVEILSPGNSAHDLIVKKRLYEKFHVKEYWIVDPNTMEFTVHSLVDGIFLALATSKRSVYSPMFNSTFVFE